MKTFFSAIIVLFIFLFGIRIYTDYLTNHVEEFMSYTEDITDAAKASKWTVCDQKINQLISAWQKCETVLSVFTDHKDLDDINRAINELKDSIEFQEQKDSVMYASVLHVLLERVLKNEQLSLENILKTNTQIGDTT